MNIRTINPRTMPATIVTTTETNAHIAARETYRTAEAAAWAAWSEINDLVYDTEWRTARDAGAALDVLDAIAHDNRAAVPAELLARAEAAQKVADAVWDRYLR